MLYSQQFGKTNKSAKEYDSINATLLIKAGFIDQTMAGVYTFLPLGLRVLNKIEDIVREEMDKIGSEVLMSTLAPKEAWEQTGRFETVDTLFKTFGANEPSQTLNSAEYILSPSHEEVLTPLAKKFNFSYKDLPFGVYQIQSKFRNEARPKSGLLRGREFRMKDLYSFHATQEDFEKYYEEAKKVYAKVYERLGLGDFTFICLASGGDFTDEFSHEFQTVVETGEDTIYLDRDNNIAYNDELKNEEKTKELDIDFSALEEIKASEVGNIFPLGSKYSDAFDYKFTDKDGTQKPVIMGCYGIGTSRVMGVLVEKFNDEKGILWPEQVAPFKVHLVGLNLEDAGVAKQAQIVYNQLQEKEVEVLFDDRVDASAGEKLGDADLIGCPYRVVVSPKTGDQVEIKLRNETEAKLINHEELLELLANGE